MDANKPSSDDTGIHRNIFADYAYKAAEYERLFFLQHLSMLGNIRLGVFL